eukprot:1156613-Pelagomonas_calceolata.AAC.3
MITKGICCVASFEEAKVNDHKRVVLPALEAFRPELVLVSSGFDASYADPLGAQILSSQDFRLVQLVLAAHCLGDTGVLNSQGFGFVGLGRFVCADKGGYMKWNWALWMATQLKAVADRHCGGKVLAVHEGGYSEAGAHATKDRRLRLGKAGAVCTHRTAYPGGCELQEQEALDKSRFENAGQFIHNQSLGMSEQSI